MSRFQICTCVPHLFIICSIILIFSLGPEKNAAKGKQKGGLKHCTSNCNKSESVFSPKHVKEMKNCYSRCLEKECDASKGFQVRCKCLKDEESLKGHCSYCCQAPKFLNSDIKTCSDDWNEDLAGEACEYFKTDNNCPECEKCYKNLDTSHCNDMTKINDCLYKKVNDFNRSKFCKTTVVNCKCVQNHKRENNIECFWGCEDKKSGDWMYYSTSRFQKYITNHTDGANDGGVICPGCPSCMEERGTLEDTEKCLEEKLKQKFMQYEVHCYCLENENEGTEKKCMWRGIELQCRRNSDSNCIRQVVGSYGVPRYELKTSSVVECKTLDVQNSSQNNEKFDYNIQFLLAICIVNYFQ